MKLTHSRIGIVAALMATAVGEMAIGTACAGPPAAPKVSSFAPVKDLVAQVEAYIARLEEAVADEEAYKDAETRIAKDANTLVLLALAAGLHDEPNSYKAAAPALMKAAQQVAGVKDFAAAKAAVAGLKKAASAPAADPASLGWTKVADLAELMKQVPLVHNRLKRNLRGERFKSRAKDNAGDSAVLAVIAQGSMADLSEAKKPGDAEKWYKFCAAMRDAAAALNRTIHAGDPAGGAKAAAALIQSCDDCHAVFHPTAKPAGEE